MNPHQQGMILLPMMMILLSVMLLLFGAQQQDLSDRWSLFYYAKRVQQAEMVVENGLISALNQHWELSSHWQCQLTQEGAQLCLKGLSDNLALLCSMISVDTKGTHITRLLYVEPIPLFQGIGLKRLRSGWRDFVVQGEEYGCGSYRP